MKRLLLSTIVLLVFTVNEICASPAHGHYRWRNDNGTEATATWKAAEDIPVTQSDESNIRLRLELYHHTSTTDFSKVCYLYYASLKDTVWQQVTDNTAKAFVFFDSPNLTNAGATVSSRLSKSNASCTNQAGLIRDVQGAFLVDFGKDQRKEYEFSIKPTPNINFDQTFIFRVEDEDVSIADFFFSVETCPRLTLSKPVLTITAKDTSRVQGAENPQFKLTYSGFVDGDDESVLGQMPGLICDANPASAPGQYNIVPYNATDNKYSFIYVPGKLTVTLPSGIGDKSLEKSLIYPNPVRDYLFISDQIDKDVTVSISDLSGRVVLEQKIVNNSLNLQSLQNGIYIVKINDMVYKITKE
ncbi:MAG: MBG domain-containing protein [Bacteroidales bacterium]